ncbi:hypothetical protein AMTRI_Chr13g84670 [Amborella trichopoda]
MWRWGEGMEKTLITGSRNVVDGLSTFNTMVTMFKFHHLYTAAVFGNGFMARALAIVNTAGPTKGQAVALHVQSNLAAFFRLNIIAYQDTLYAHSLHHFYRDCHIYDTVDFIFSNAAEVFQNCHFFACRPMPKQKNMITAHGRFEPTQETGFIFQNCTIQASPDLEPVKGNFSTYLGRPWRSQARVTVMQSYLGMS